MNNQHPKLCKKEIQSDPVAALARLGQDNDEASVTAMEELWREARSLKQQHKNIKTQSKILSRQIGEAKRDGKPIDDLKTSMQEKSAQLESVENKLNDIENRIQVFFEEENKTLPGDESSTKPKSGDIPATRNYKSTINNTDRISVSLLKDERDAWNSYVENNPAATLHHRAEWRQLLHQAYGLECFYFIACNTGNGVVGVLPLVRMKSRLFGDFLVSMPWFARGGAIADHPLIEHKLMQTAENHAKALGVTHIEYRDDIPREGLPVHAHKVNMVLDLPDSTEDLWQGFTSKLRAQIKRPKRENPQIQIGGKKLLDDFYSVYTRNMRDLGSPAHSKDFLSTILATFPENSWIIALHLNNRPVAAGFLLGQGDTLEIPLASTIRDVNSLSMNMLLYWEVLKFAIDQGFKHLDFGRSSKDAGTYRFKRQWGAQPKQLYWHYWLGKAGEPPSLNPSNPKYALVINTWKRLPVSITNWLGPKIVKHLP